ncbi:MAG: DegV family protein [Candidatus Heimdallarchaeum endolithica]|uniref:DegV family protein n=1 Tax=Candidatus Heimdallarchaeum endolithica TaxID=2876572 RepID=A0A9Y1FP21_9ARCH|nr:MAG: DegV family protein [Candidatus Heimdallarchaeum endolithica]
MTVKIMTDSAADIPEYLLKENDISTVPTVIRFGDDVYYENKDITLERYYELFHTHPVPPQTANPTLADDFELYKKLGEEADEVINIVISSGISGSFNTSNAALKMYEKRVKDSAKVYVFDSHFATMGIGVQALKAAEMAKEGYNATEILAMLEEYREKLAVAFTVDNLEYLHRGGRLSKSKFWIAKLADLHPVITFIDGKMEVEKTSRGYDNAMEKAFDLSWEKINKAKKFNAYICYGENKDHALYMRDYIQDKIDAEYNIEIYQVGATIITHTGPEVSGILLDPYNEKLYKASNK